MNNVTNNDKTSNPGASIGSILNSMMEQLTVNSLNASSSVQQISNATTTSLGRIVDTVASPQSLSQSSGVANQLLSAFNPLASRGSSGLLSSLFLGPLWRGIFNIFSGGSSNNEPPTLTPFEFPNPTRTDVSATSSRDQAPTTVRRDSLGLSQSALPAAQPVNITIQALDGRSILDRSDDIAAALRKAMMSNHEINDNLGEL